VIDDARLIEATAAWRLAQAAREQLQPEYERKKTLVNQPANATLVDLHATDAEQDEAFGTFSDVAHRYHDMSQIEQRARHTYEQAHARAYAARKAWHQEKVRERERELVELIAGPVMELVRQIGDVIVTAGAEEIPVTVTPCDFPNIPLRLGGPQQPGLEFVVEQLRALIARP
jgi:hypothetical protein